MGPPGHLGHFVPGVSKILGVRDRAQEDRFQNSGKLKVYREAQTDIPALLFIPDKSAWPRLLRATEIRSWLCALRLQGDTFFRKDASVRHVAVSERRSSSRSSSTVFNSASNARAAIPKRASRSLSMTFRVVSRAASRVHSALSSPSNSSSNGDSIMALRPPKSWN